MIYVLLRSSGLQAERIRVRVEEGGHDVPADKIVARRARSFEQLAWFFQRVDDCFIYDNSTGEPELIAEKVGPAMACWQSLPADFETIMRDGGVSLHRA